MLNVDPEKRPNINTILGYPVIAQRVQKLLTEDDFRDEFSHTILHNQNVFDEFKAIQATKKKEEERKQKLAAEEAKLAQQRMADLRLNEYKPKYGQDKELFNEMFMHYIDQLHKSNEPTAEPATPSYPSTVSERPFSQ